MKLRKPGTELIWLGKLIAHIDEVTEKEIRSRVRPLEFSPGIRFGYEGRHGLVQL